MIMNGLKAFIIGVGSLGVSAPMLAQSTVKIYGSIDNTIQYVHNNKGQHSQNSLQGGQFSVNRWGFKGLEDLGGGLHAIFQLENGFDINSGKAGQGGAEFGPEAFVGLTSDSYGTIIAGCQNDTFQDLVYGVQSNYLYYFTAHGDEDNADRTARNSNDLERQSERRIR